VPPPDAVRSAEGDAHVIVAEGGVTAALGGVVLPVTVDEADAVHPLAPVTVTVKVFALLTEIEVVVAPVLHKYVPPPDAVRSAEGDAHVMLAEGGVTAALGGVVFPVTILEAEAVHPLAAVAVTV